MSDKQFNQAYSRARSVGVSVNDLPAYEAKRSADMAAVKAQQDKARWIRDAPLRASREAERRAIDEAARKARDQAFYKRLAEDQARDVAAEKAKRAAWYTQRDALVA